MSILTRCNIKDCKYKSKTFRRGHCQTHYKEYKHKLAQWSRAEARKPRPAIIEGSIAKIPLGINTKDGYAIVDKDFAWLDRYKWGLGGTGYACMATNNRLKLQYFIVRQKKGFQIDHINNNRVDNRKSNLRLVTQRQNLLNSRPRSSNGYKGVSYSKRTPNAIKVWRSYIKPNGKQISLGLFETAEEAAKAYDIAAKKYFGKYAYLNFP